MAKKERRRARSSRLLVFPLSEKPASLTEGGLAGRVLACLLNPSNSKKVTVNLKKKTTLLTVFFASPPKGSHVASAAD